jgi:predicted glycogen debranching enzyme
LSSLDEEVNGISLANHQYPGAIYPRGFEHLQEMSLDPLPRFQYLAGDCRVEKTSFLLQRENTLIISYRTQGTGKMRVVPLVHCRSFHAAAELPGMRQQAGEMGTHLCSPCEFYLFSDKAGFVQQELVYYNFEYEAERRRGLAWKENLFSPGFFDVELDGQTDFAIVASTERPSLPDVKMEMRREALRLGSLHAPIARLAQAADSFLVWRDKGLSIIAGYHWFDDWGRDAMIALPGLLLCTGRFREAREVLKTFAAAMQDGILPNDLGARSYNTVDASLWFLRAVYRYYDCTGDLDFIRQLWPALLSVVERYSLHGPEFGMGEDGLIASGPALSWMDARVDGRPVTPRAGKACEINALWYSGLKSMEALAGALDEPWNSGPAQKARQSYQRFWNSETGCLFDVLDPQDASIRPNQIIAAAIPDLLPMIMRKSVLNMVTRDLLTPYGLRTLSPRDPRYVGRYEGGPGQRDGGYHQGTVWPWLMGPYIDALLSVNDYSPESKKTAMEILQPLMELDAGGINTIPEIFDGEAPQRTGGCISQAWSVAEVLRVSALLRPLLKE